MHLASGAEALARTLRKSVQKDDKPPGQRSPRTLKAILVLTMIVLTAAVGLMAWNAHKESGLNELRLLQRDALLAGERLNQRASRATDRIETELRSGASIASIDPAYVGVDQLATLEAALSSNGTTLSRAGAAAAGMTSRNQRLSLLDDGNLVLVHVPAVGKTVVATIAADRWLPAPAAGSRLLLYGEASVSVGDRTVVPPDSAILARGAGFRMAGPLQRSATACAGLANAEFSLCLARKSPLFSLDNILDGLLSLLLLIIPALAISGLYSQLDRGAPAGGRKPAAPSVPSGKYELAAASARVGFWDINTGRGTAWINEEAARLLGVPTHGELPLASLMNAVHASHRPLLEDAIGEARPSRPFSINVASSSSGGGSWLEFRGSQIYSNEDHSAMIGGVLFDVTETIRSQERQRMAEARLRSAIETFPCPFALWDAKKRLYFWNREFERIFALEKVLRPGVSQETVLLARSGNVISEKAEADDNGVTLLGLRSGEWIKLVERATQAGTIISFGLDVTADVKNEEQLTRQKKQLKNLVQELERSEGHNAELARKYNEEKAKAERSADSKSAFLANMSHELRTPLNAINGFSEILVNEMYGPLGDKRYGEYALDILNSGQHLLDMINDILDIAKIEAGKMTIDPKPIDLADPVDAAVRMIRRKAEDKGIQISLQTEDNLPEVDADHRAVRQMMLNLLSNAIKFTDAGGRIIVAVQRKNDQIRVAVRDTGVGIPKEHLPRLAKPFEQVQETRERNYDGTGLGLALTKSFAEMHGGSLSIASEPGRGTMVSFYLPISKDTSRSDRNVA